MDIITKSLSDLTITEIIKETKIIAETKKKILTEDTGKIFEMAICLAYGIEYNGKYKYNMEIPEKLKLRLIKVVELFPMCKHTAKGGERYDFTSLTDKTKHLSAKSTKKGGGKVAPQVIGQVRPEKFCKIINIPYTTKIDLKKYIQINIQTILPILVSYTFDCPNIYYNKKEDTIRFITLNKMIVWSNYKFKWTRTWDKWNNSSTLQIIIRGKIVSLLEFQFHTTRPNMAIRWCYENFLTIFNEKLCIVNI